MATLSRGLVYYMLDATRVRMYVKIGTTINLRERLEALRRCTTSGQTPIVLALEEGGLEEERKLHERFRELRSHGEWFDLEDELREHLALLEHPFSFLLERPQLWQYGAGWGPLSSAAGSMKPFAPPPTGPRTQREIFGVDDLDDIKF